MRDNVKIVAILNIVLGSLGALAGIVVLVIFGGIAGMAGFANDQNAAAAVPVLALIGTCIAVFLFILSVPAIIGGWGMLKFRPWARILMIIVSVLNLLHFPFGTALGVYGLIVLLNEETRRLFETGGTYVPAPQYAPQSPYGQPAYGPAGGYAPPGYPQQPPGYSPQPPPPPPTPGT
jgi:hypothetical protein